MTDAKFLEFWKEIIHPFLKHKLRGDDQLYTLYDIDPLCAEYDRYKNLRAQKEVAAYYDYLRANIKKDFMGDINGLLDRHKLCACMYKAIINVNILKFKSDDTSLLKDMLINIDVAFYAACSVLLSFMINNYAKSDPKFVAFLEKRKMLCFPSCNSEDSKESYQIQTIKCLCHAQRHENLNILMLANIFSNLESYTKLAYKNEAQL